MQLEKIIQLTFLMLLILKIIIGKDVIVHLIYLHRILNNLIKYILPVEHSGSLL